MKKISVVLLALCLVGSAIAGPLQKKELSIKQSKSVNLKTVRTKKQHSELQIPTSTVKYDKVLKSAVTNKKPMRRLSAGKENNYTIADGYALYLGNYFEIYQGVWYGHIWEIDFETNEGAQFSLFPIHGIARNRLEYNYNNVEAFIAIGQDTIEAEGSLDIAYLKEGTATSPTYTFNGTFADELGNTYNLSGDYAFPAGEVFDYGYSWACEDYGIGCSDIDIILIDAPVTPTGDSTFVEIESSALMNYGYENEVWVAVAENEEVYFTTQFAAPYVLDADTIESPCDLAETELYSVISREDIDIKTINEVVVSKEGDALTIVYNILGFDGTIYSVTTHYTKPVPQGNPISITAFGEFQDLREEYGILFVNGAQDEDQKYTIYNAIYSEELTGEFTEKDTYFACTNDVVSMVENGDTITYQADRYTIKLDTMRIQGTLYFIYKMDLVGVNVANTADVKEFKITMFTNELDPYMYDAEEDVSLVIKADPKEIFDTQYFSQEGIVIAIVQSGSYYFVGLIYADSDTEKNVIPEGEYAIDFSEESPSMLASQGVDAEGSIYYSFLGIKGTQGIEDLWSLVEGKMTMYADKMVVEAKNGKGYNVNITIKFPTTGLTDVLKNQNIQNKKLLINGQMLLINNKRVFNILGTEL